MQKAKLEIFVQCLKKPQVQFLLQAACRLSRRWEENTNAEICCTHWLSTTKLVLNQVTWVQRLEQHSISTTLCSEADHSELLSILPVSPWPVAHSHSSCPRTHSLHSPGNQIYGAGHSTACVYCPVNLLGSSPAWLAKCKRETGGAAVEALGT